MSAFFQDDASGVLHGPAVRAEVAGGPALVPGSPGHPDLLPGKRRMDIPEDLRQNSRQGLTVSTGTWCLCSHGSSVKNSLNIYQTVGSYVTVCCQREPPPIYSAVCEYFDSDRCSVIVDPHSRTLDLRKTMMMKIKC